MAEAYVHFYLNAIFTLPLLNLISISQSIFSINSDNTFS